jgi:alkanesulfonate monooxygenase SsuD/methylene tetrahydromethanopterin reductase-like flavin-dependent oxidoreductase (luciferase family)
MKFHWFHLMPWPYLPDDFTEKHRSVWVDPDYEALFDPAKANHVYNEYMDELEFAEKAGFDGVCVNEHHSNAYGLMPSPNIIAAGLARRTSEAALVVMGNSIALYNPPLRVAEEFAMLDIISGGRLVAGFPTGTSMDVNFAYGMQPNTFRERYYEAHDMIMQAWHEKGVTTFNGKFNQNRYVNPWPRPLQQPNPPIWIPGGGSIETWEWCADMGYLYAYLSYSGYLRAQNIMNGFWQRMRDKDKEANPYQAGFFQVMAIAETDAQAKELYEEHILYFYKRCLHIYGGFADAPGYRTNRTVKAGIRSQLDALAQAARFEMTWENLVDAGYVIAGSPATVIEKLNNLVDDLRVGHLMCGLQMGNMPREKALYNTQMFAEKVAPHLRNKWSEYEDKWYPKPLARIDRADPISTPYTGQLQPPLKSREAMLLGGGGE